MNEELELYNGDINEFIDWVTGENSFTQQDATEGKPVSGEAIRKLLQSKLKTPFVMKEDKVNNRYRMFSSEEAYQLWAENPSDNTELELFNFVRPSDYKLEFIGLDNSNRYIRLGDSTSLNSRIQFTFSVRNDEGISSEGIEVTYSIENKSIGKTNTFTRWYNAGDRIDFSIYDYLKSGENSVTISGRSLQNGARSSASFNIILLELSLTSQFNFCDKFQNNTYINIPCYFTRNDESGTAKIYFIIDEGAQSYETDVLANSGTSINVSKSILLDLAPGLHTLQIYGQAQYNEGSTVVNTNLLYFTFAVASTDISIAKYILVSTSFNTGAFPFNGLVLTSQQYLQSKLSWGYYTDAQQTDSKININWKLYRNEDDQNPIQLSNLVANNKIQSEDLSFVPTIYSEYGQNSVPLTYLSAQYTSNNVTTELLRIPIQIVRNGDFTVTETVPYSYKLSAFGKTNDSLDRNNWDNLATFTNIQWNPNSGWYENSFRTSKQNEYATISIQPFLGFDIATGGKTIEVDFETEKVNSNDDILMVIGTPNQGRIEITPVKATLYSNANEPVIFTNYKSNERLRLSFILIGEDAVTFPEKDRGLAMIVNNGILERAKPASGLNYAGNGSIKIGGSNSGIRVYSIKTYDYPLTYTQAFNNFVYDSENKINIFNKNNIVGLGNKISYDLCKNKIDTILISGDLSMILNKDASKEASQTEVTIERICPYDTTKNFKINRALIRKHGQSTLNYPISSMKIWFNKSNTPGVVPTFELLPQETLQLNKNRYRMKSNSIPSNKYVLQANYADSSGVHNGGFQRLIQRTWYDAQINGKYLLRTEPQLFTSISSANKSQYGLDKVWDDYFPNQDFPYELQIAPDSFPCVVFYQNVGDETQTFLGQYVFMEDKKSDFLYGERTIYKVKTDPFCLTTAHKDDDTKANRIWNNKDVLRVEVIGSNDTYSSYITPIASNLINDIETIEDETTHQQTQRFRFENSYELIYPDPDDIAEDDEKLGINKFDPSSKYISTIQPFVDFYNWVVSTRNNQQKFQDEAADHLDLYKMAAYYIFALRFGLVDSLERNAQIKTYDGVHFHYEPWDMDIALGNKNDGGIAYNPPINRNTKLPNSLSTYAFSGRSANDQGEIVTSNWLWDALEAWDQWQIIVRDVANALYNAGLTYNNVIQMFDEEYQDKWCETIYNKSGEFKYIDSRDNDKWLDWLQGARTTHRHWWLSTSMDYYDAAWFCGDYRQHRLYITANVSIGDSPIDESEEGVSGTTYSDKQITVIPNKNTYIVIQKDYNTINTENVSPVNPLVYNVPVMNTKNPFHIYGANFIESVDFSQIAQGLDGITWSGVYSEVLGSPVKEINLGTILTADENNYTTTVATTAGSSGDAISQLLSGSAECFKSLQNLNIRGYRNARNIRDFMYNNDISSLQNFYAMGSGLINFYSSKSGNIFNKLELPSTLNILSLTNSTWNNIEFWDCSLSGSTGTLSRYSVNIDGQPTEVPDSIQTLELMGTSCQNANSLDLVRQWLRAINDSGNDLSIYSFKADKINWSLETIGSESNLLTFDELSILAQTLWLGEDDQGNDLGYDTTKLSGYILLKNEGVDLTAQQLTLIKSWFGDSVFDRSSSGLIIDHYKNYIQINVGGNVQVINGEIYIHEGQRATLNATQFLLSEQVNNNYVWSITAGSALQTEGYSREKGCYIIQSDQSSDEFTYLQTEESKIGINYDVKIWVKVLGNSYSTTIHVIGVTYPQNISMSIDNLGTRIPKQTPLYIGITGGSRMELYTPIDTTYTATVGYVRYTLSDGVNTVSYTSNTQSEESRLCDTRLAVTQGTKGVILDWSFSSPENIEYVTITSLVHYISGKELTLTKTIVIADDTQALISSAQTILWNAIDVAWTTQFGTGFPSNYVYKVDLLNLQGELTFVESGGLVLTSLLTSEGDSLLNYIPNVTGLTFDNCASLPSVNNSVNQLVFTNTHNLTKLSVQNCTSLNQTIDLTHCPNITQVDASGTSVNVLVPEDAPLTKYELGTPTSVTLISPTVLTNAQVVVDNSTNITDIDIENMGSNTAFKTFAKIMNL